MNNTIENRELRHELHNLRKDYIAAVEQIQELQTKPAAKEQWIMVTHRRTWVKDDPFSLGTAFSVTKLGAREALEQAQDLLAHSRLNFSNLEFRLEGGEW
tara:strand:- start:140 stop:439 length:300 start_codon:yes stop_codon:yes gene_type:complete